MDNPIKTENELKQLSSFPAHTSKTEKKEKCTTILFKVYHPEIKIDSCLQELLMFIRNRSANTATSDKNFRKFSKVYRYLRIA